MHIPLITKTSGIKQHPTYFAKPYGHVPADTFILHIFFFISILPNLMHYQAMIEEDSASKHITATLDCLLDGGPEPGTPPRPCSACRSIWWCTCPGRSLSYNYIPTSRRRSRSPRRQCGNESADSAQQTRSRSRERCTEAVIAGGARHAPTPSAPAPSAAIRQGGQNSWAMVKSVLTDKVLRLERTETMFKNLLDDLRISINLPNSTHYIQHAKGVIAAIHPAHRFKIGITNDPDTRYYHAHYAYRRSHVQERDGVRYSGMVVIFAHQSRDVIAMMEHALIAHWLQHAPHRCANRKTDFDNHINYDSGSESDHDSAGPHVLYVAHGERI
jgi:hypothetical protein